MLDIEVCDKVWHTVLLLLQACLLPLARPHTHARRGEGTLHGEEENPAALYPKAAKLRLILAGIGRLLNKYAMFFTIFP